MFRAGFATLFLATSALAGDDHCTLAGDGDVDLCEKVYWRSRLATLAIPSYTLSTDGLHVHHGVSWTVAIDIPKDEWSEYFALGVDRDALPHGFPFQLGAAASFIWLPNYALEGRLVLRARIMSLAFPSNPALSFVHLTVGAGGAGGTLGFFPRIELRMRIGHVAWGGAVLVAGFQTNPLRDAYYGDASVGFEAPWVWWW